jgi:LysM repeat protein
MKIRRRGRHTTPSQVEKVADKAGKAAPALAIAGVLVAVPQHHTSGPAKHVAVTAEHHQKSAAVTKAATLTAKVAKPTHRTYTVESGNTLVGIAREYYHNANDWQWLYHENDTTVSDPNLIYPGEVLSVPYDPPAHYTLPSSATQQTTAATSTPTTTTSDASSSSSSSSDASSSTNSSSSAVSSDASGGSTSLSGTLSCSGLEQLWEDAGGSSGEAFTAAEIAMAESGGDQYATNPYSDTKGYWQISPVWGSLSSYDALTNAEAAVQISDDGSNWSPWTTYTSGAYDGQC